MKLSSKILVLFSLTLFVFSTTIGQTKSTVKGMVKDDKNKAINDVVIYVDDVKTDVKVSKSGTFKLNVTSDTKTIKAFSYSRGVVELKYSGQKKMNFIFKNLWKKGSVKKSTASTKNGVHFNNIFDMIRQKIPNIKVDSRTGTIMFRGTSSFNASSSPLLIVDGGPVSSIDNIPPSQVKSITALKGPEAAIYGVRGAHGVLIITLKKKI